MSFTYYREIDRLGRVVVPMDIRKSLSINAGDMLKSAFSATARTICANLRASLYAPNVGQS